MSTFQSPLALRHFNEFTACRFGPVDPAPAVVQLRHSLNAILLEVADILPEPLRSEARLVLRNYSGGDGDFFGLFYSPVWSFLHWSTGPLAAADVLPAARAAQAMSLFIHLWDDHLCDGQLPLDLLRLHFRTLAWDRFASSTQFITDRLGAPADWHLEATAEYLTALHAATPAESLEEYCAHFSREIAIWLLVPRLLGCGALGKEAGAALVNLVQQFSIAWRLLDDVQDVQVDVRSKRTAVWFEIGAEGRMRWEECRAFSPAQGELDPARWETLRRAIADSGAVTRLLARIDGCLAACVELAEAQGWSGLALELTQSRAGLIRPAD